jgi:hypothetical protein
MASLKTQLSSGRQVHLVVKNTNRPGDQVLGSLTTAQIGLATKHPGLSRQHKSAWRPSTQFSHDNTNRPGDQALGSLPRTRIGLITKFSVLPTFEPLPKNNHQLVNQALNSFPSLKLPQDPLFQTQPSISTYLSPTSTRPTPPTSLLDLLWSAIPRSSTMASRLNPKRFKSIEDALVKFGRCLDVSRHIPRP